MRTNPEPSSPSISRKDLNAALLVSVMLTLLILI
jgi:hypothetical protein